MLLQPTRYTLFPYTTLFRSSYSGWKSFNNSSSGQHLDLINLMAGTYTLTLNPAADETMSFNVAAVSAVTGTLTPNTPMTVNLAQPGQIAVLTVNATAGELSGTYLSKVTETPSNLYVVATMLAGDGNQL